MFYEPHNSANIRMRYLIRIRQVDVDPRRVFEKHPLFTIKTQPISDTHGHKSTILTPTIISKNRTIVQIQEPVATPVVLLRSARKLVCLK